MTDMLLQEDETLEELQPGGYLLLQKKNGFRFGMDSVLLAEFAGIRPHSSVADFGTGSCVLPLLLLSMNCTDFQFPLSVLKYSRTSQIWLGVLYR